MAVPAMAAPTSRSWAARHRRSPSRRRASSCTTADPDQRGAKAAPGHRRRTALAASTHGAACWTGMRRWQRWTLKIQTMTPAGTRASLTTSSSPSRSRCTSKRCGLPSYQCIPARSCSPSLPRMHCASMPTQWPRGLHKLVESGVAVLPRSTCQGVQVVQEARGAGGHDVGGVFQLRGPDGGCGAAG